jgi:hypothetical protein
MIRAVPKGRSKGKPAARSGRHVVWVKAHCRRKPESRYAKKERQNREMPF